ncbi:MAG: hypothetical protein ACE5GN_07560 [Waddliaceae bacterium]
MSVEFGPSEDELQKKGVSKKERVDTPGLSEGVSSVKRGVKGVATSRFPHPIDAVTNELALKLFDCIKEACRLSRVAVMVIPAGKAVPEGIRAHTVSKEIRDFFSVIAKEGLYKKWIEAVAEQTQKEIQVERQENRNKKYRQVLKKRFRDYLNQLKEKQGGTPSAP